MDAGGPVRAEREKRGPSASPPVPIKTYQWEEIRRARQQGGYPWTYLDKPPLEGAEITAEEVLRNTAPRMSSRDNSRERRAPEPQKILMLDASPGSSRKVTEGEDESAPAAIHIPNFSKEISLDSEEDILEKADPSVLLPDNLRVEEAKVVNVSPKSILKRKHAEEQPAPVAQAGTDESPRNSKCCHPLVEKIKHIADKTMHKQPKKDAQSKQKRNDIQEIILLDCSPGTERRERKKAVELEKELEHHQEKSISFVMQNDELIKSKEHVYEDMVVDAKEETEPSEKDIKKANDGDTKSGDSKDPSLLIDDEPMEDDDTVTAKITKLKNMYDTSMAANKSGEDITEGVVVEADDSPDPSKADDTGKGSPNFTITDVTDEEQQPKGPQEPQEDKKVHFEVGDDGANSTPPKEAEDEEGVEDFWSKMSDHEYEPIGKPLSESELKAQAQEPPQPQQPQQLQQSQHLQKSAEPMAPPAPPATPPPPALYVSEPELAPKTFKDDDASSTTSHERQLLRPPTEDDTTHMDYEGGDDTEPPSSSMALQRQIEDRYFVNTPTTTTESRTDCEISTSQVDSSALENLPLKRENRKRNVVGEEASKLHQKIKNQTGKLKTKLKTIKKPQFSMPERPKFNLPERPKFTMPERPKFSMPERPKFNLPERPKMPKMPERPKINLPDRPKFRMPERPKFNMPEKPKFLEKAKFNLPDRPKFTMPDKSKFKFPDRPKINFSAFTRNKENAQKEKTTEGSLTDSTSGSKRRKIEFDFRTYPRFARFKKDKKGGKTSKGERPGTPPPGFATVPRVTKDRQAVMSTSHWEDMSSNMSSEEPRHYGLPKDYPNDKDNDFESKLAQVDKDYNQMQEEYERERMQNVEKVKLENAELWNAMERNSAQRLEHRRSLPFYISGNAQSNEELGNTVENGDDESSAASTGHHRRGVLEEIDNDEFFLRQKGISQDNIEVGKYLSDEIRDAFRSPVNALNQLDNAASFDRQKPHLYVEHLDPENDEMFDENIDKTDLNEELDHTQDIDHDDGYYTFPPVRPSRSRKQKALERQSQLQQEPSIEISDSINDVEEVPAPPMFQEPPPKREQEPEKVETSQRKSLFSSAFKEPEMLENLNEYENEMDQTREVPTIPKRRKKLAKGLSYSESGSLFNEPYEDDKWTKPKDQDDRMIDDEIIVHRMEYVMPHVNSELPEESPVAPRRMRSRSRGSRATSACDDDRTSRGADSLTLDSHTHLATVDNEWNLDDVLDDPGYAIVEKPALPKKSEPPPRPPAPVRRHRSSKSLSGDRQSADRQFFTVPRALKESTPPKRPSRNYSTLGPSRPPRKKSTTSLTDLNKVQQDQTGSSDTTQYVEIDDEEFDPHKDLQSGDVIRKMKHRPLPPPPRPPRGPKRRKDISDEQDPQFIPDDDIDLDFDLNNVPDGDIQIDRIHGGMNFEMPPLTLDEMPIDDYDQEEIIEIEVSTQTDPLPDDFDYTIGMEEPFIDNEKQILTPQNESQADDMEENSIDAEILSRGLQRFRESSRPESRNSRPRTPIERPKTPIERPKTPLDRMSPTAILVERRVSSPTRIDERDVMVTEASLTVMPMPIDDSDSYETESKSTSSQKAIIRTEPIVLKEPVSESKPDTIDETQIMPILKEPLVKKEPIIERIPTPLIEPTIESDLIIESELTNVEEPIVERIQIAQFAPLSQSEPIVRIETHAIPKPKVEKPETTSNVIINNDIEISTQALVFQTPEEPIAQIVQAPHPDYEIYPRPIPRERPSEIWTALNNANIPIPTLPSLEVERVAPSTSANVPPAQVITQHLILKDPEVEIVRTQKLQVADLDVERLNVGELQASKILVSEIEGLSLHVSDVNSKSGNIVVRNIEFAPEIIDEIVQKFAQLVPPSVPAPPPVPPPPPKSESTQQTQTDTPPEAVATPIHFEPSTSASHPVPSIQEIVFEMQQHSPNLEFTVSGEAPERPPLPHMPGTAYPAAFYQDYSMIPPVAFQRMRSDFSEGDPPLPSSRRRKHKREIVSSSEEEYRPTPRRAQPRTSSEPSVAELSSQLFRACQNSVSRTARYIISYITSQFGSGENKKDMQMALVIVLVMIAGLILLGVGDGRTVHHHHWDFFNPPNDK